ncbi:hypothetical protein NFI96_007626 [Prochilodus magdalenae]|nr:hypothetical protein NFI96_007626 [Prochilodus magdalenae]
MFLPSAGSGGQRVLEVSGFWRSLRFFCCGDAETDHLTVTQAAEQVSADGSTCRLVSEGHHKITQEVLLEALSALTGTPVRNYPKHKGGSMAVELTVDSFLPAVFEAMFQYGLTGGLNSSLSSLMSRLSVNSLDLEPFADEEEETEISTFRREYFVNMDKFFDQKFDYDFRRDSDSSQCSRGGEPYARPWGWYRFALKVKNKYPNGNAWLGPKGWRSHSAAGEWPVSFHGTSINGAKGITSSYYRAGPREAYGRGIYSTPDIGVADRYAMSKKFKSKNGKTYKVIMQNRINPSRRVKTMKENYWLIPVPQGISQAEEKMVVETSIRPYAIGGSELLNLLGGSAGQATSGNLERPKC